VLITRITLRVISGYVTLKNIIIILTNEIQLKNKKSGTKKGEYLNEMKNLLGITIKVMTLPDMFAHKLCALTDRSEMANRDLFDCWFFMKNRTSLNEDVIEKRMEMPVGEYLQKCITFLENKTDIRLLDGLGELIDPDLKQFVKSKLRTEVITLLRLYNAFPIRQ
jgi:predicted nucleotidyltransferase component of viral defense system